MLGAATMPRQRITVSADDLHAAWLQRRRPGWPNTLEATLADPLLGRLVHAEAVGRAIAVRRHERKHAALPAPRPATPAAPPTAAPQRRTYSPGPDRKRAAAGDRDDD